MNRSYLASTALCALAVTGMFQAGDLAAQDREQAQDSITGTITGTNANAVTVQTNDERSVTVRVDLQTRIQDERGQRETTRAEDLLGNLESGDRVVVRYRTNAEGEHLALSIDRQAAEGQDNRAAADLNRQREETRQEQLRTQQQTQQQQNQQAQQQTQQQNQQDQMRRQDELPRTSSTLPLLAALGLLGLAGAGALSVAARRAH